VSPGYPICRAGIALAFLSSLPPLFSELIHLRCKNRVIISIVQADLEKINFSAVQIQ
jgi:hypothetical protein